MKTVHYSIICAGIIMDDSCGTFKTLSQAKKHFKKFQPSLMKWGILKVTYEFI